MLNETSTRPMPETSAEEWRPVYGYESFYAVSSHGRVRSLNREVWTRNGHFRKYEGRLLTTQIDTSGRPVVTLSRNGTVRMPRVCVLVAEAFHGPRPAGLMVRHLNDIKTDNRPENLAWGTMAENGADYVRNGFHHYARRECCEYGHEYSGPNLMINPSKPTARLCRACNRARCIVARQKLRGVHVDFRPLADAKYAELMSVTDVFTTGMTGAA